MWYQVWIGPTIQAQGDFWDGDLELEKIAQSAPTRYIIPTSPLHGNTWILIFCAEEPRFWAASAQKYSWSATVRFCLTWSSRCHRFHPHSPPPRQYLDTNILCRLSKILSGFSAEVLSERDGRRFCLTWSSRWPPASIQDYSCPLVRNVFFDFSSSILFLANDSYCFRRITVWILKR